MVLNDERLLQRVVPPLAKQFGVQKEAVWDLLENQSNGLQKLISMQKDSKLRGEVNEWWRHNRHRFSSFGMVQFVRVEPKNLPQSTYEQVICLMWLTDNLRQKKLAKITKKPAYIKPASVKVAETELNLWQRAIMWFKNLFGRRGMKWN